MVWWARGDSNPGFPARKAGVLGQSRRRAPRIDRNEGMLIKLYRICPRKEARYTLYRAMAIVPSVPMSSGTSI